MELGSYIDHTKLGFTVTTKQVEKLCEEAREYHFASVCVPPCYVPVAKQALKDCSVAVCTVVGFPHGNQLTDTKVFEAKKAIEMGADEIDMVMNIGALKEQSYDYIIEELNQVRDACGGHILKVIIETSVLSDDEIREATKLCNLCFIHFVKTCTGFGTRGVLPQDLDIINEEKNEVLEVKASGGIATYEDAILMIEHGATRIGTSHGVEIMKGEAESEII